MRKKYVKNVEKNFIRRPENTGPICALNAVLSQKEKAYTENEYAQYVENIF